MMTRAGLVEALLAAGIEVVDSRRCWVQVPVVGLPAEATPADLAWVMAQL